MANFVANATGQNTGTAVFSDLSTVNYARTIYININSSPIGTQQESWVVGASATPASSYVANFVSLNPNTSYIAYCTVYRNSPWELVYSNSATFTTLPPPISAWEWYYDKISGEDFNLTRSEWLAFCNKIDEVRVAKGYSTYGFTTSTNFISSGKPFYAWIFSEAVYALDEMSASIAWQLKDSNYVSSGKPIYAWFFTNLKGALNNLINTL